MKRTTNLLLAAIVLVAVPACDSNDADDNGGNAPGTYTATISGTVNANISGVASAVQIAGTWGLALGPGDPRRITITAQGQERPGPGTYPIIFFGQATGSEVQLVASVVAEPDLTSYGSTTGSITIQSSTIERVIGTFSFEARRGTVANPSIINVEGSFHARDFSQTAR